jgi:hypothetical protein
MDDGSAGAGSATIEEGRRWSIWIDIEGFSTLWPRGNLAVLGLRALMRGIFLLGTRLYTSDGDRLFAHQFGDGFVIVADFHEPELDRCAAIAVALMRFVTHAGCTARAAIAEGEFADISGLWPREIQEAEQRSGADDVVTLGSGLMTLLPVMGTALINANKLDSRNPLKGAVLSIATVDVARLSAGFACRAVPGLPEISTIDWVHAVVPLLDTIARAAGVGRAEAEAEAAIRAYVAAETPPARWIADTFAANNMA